MKTHKLNFEIAKIGDDVHAVSYFYKREKRDVNGNSRFRVYIFDVDAPVVYEKIFKCYEFDIPERVRAFVKEAANE